MLEWLNQFKRQKQRDQLQAMRSIRFTLKDFREFARPRSPRKIYVYSVIIGAIGGLLALLFEYLAIKLETYAFQNLAGLDPHAPGLGIKHETNYSVLLFLPVIGLFISGVLVQAFSREAGGAGTDATIKAFHQRSGAMSSKVPLVKFFATLSVLAGGGSAGKEGPISLIGAGVGSNFARVLGLGDKARRTLFLAGMAGALGAIFRAPLGAAITAVEVLYKEDFESGSLIPCILASITGYFIFSSVHGFEPLFQLESYQFTDYHELIYYLALGLFCFAVGLVFIKAYHAISAFFDKLPWPFFVRCTIGGLLVGCIGLFSQEAMGSGFGFLQVLMEQGSLKGSSMLNQSIQPTASFQNTLLYLGVIVILKILTTSITIGSGGSGGVFGPSLFLGGVLGAMVGMLAMEFSGDQTKSFVPFIVVGMGGFFAGVANAPIASVIMVSELTGSYQLLAPLLLVAILHLIISTHKRSVYKEQKLNKFYSPAHEWETTQDFLQSIPLQSAISRAKAFSIVSSETTIKEVIKVAVKHHTTDFLVVDEDQQFMGTVSLRYLSHSDRKDLIQSGETVAKIVQKELPGLHTTESLSAALKTLVNYDFDKVPVVDDDNILQGYTTFRDILKAYHRKVTHIDPITGKIV